MQKDPPLTRTKPRYDLNIILYWSKLALGLVFGFLSYMIMRLSDLTFFLMIPLLLIFALVISFVLVWFYNQKYMTRMSTKRMIWKSISSYTGTYIIAFLALATLSFYWGA